MCVLVCVCVCARARACVCACVYVCVRVLVGSLHRDVIEIVNDKAPPTAGEGEMVLEVETCGLSLVDVLIIEASVRVLFEAILSILFMPC